jgi:Arc/MetJ family transcription regulator
MLCLNSVRELDILQRSNESIEMRTTIDIPDDLLARAMTASGARSKRDAVCWALATAVRHKAAEDLLGGDVAIEFATTPEDLEAREIRHQYGTRRRRRPR